ncbi:MAG TPA: hypothetical protein VJB08_03010 [Candidatus Nanoarchaeia archaeon]|nr:hypothetical protein [Candidatus Nanoarchaeia archaeon]
MKVRCPKCSNSMLYEPRVAPKKKACVYCGKIFDCRSALIRDPPHSSLNTAQ